MTDPTAIATDAAQKPRRALPQSGGTYVRSGDELALQDDSRTLPALGKTAQANAEQGDTAQAEAEMAAFMAETAKPADAEQPVPEAGAPAPVTVATQTAAVEANATTGADQAAPATPNRPRARPTPAADTTTQAAE